MDLFQKSPQALLRVKEILWVLVVLLGSLCGLPPLLEAQQPQNPPPQETPEEVEGFWQLSDEERQRDELPSRPSPYEIEQVRLVVREAFETFLRLWEEERYFELYELGTQQSRNELTPEEFATRMVQLDWVPAELVASDPIEIAFRYRTFIYVDATIRFVHKAFPTLQFQKRQTFLLLWENQKWRFDLLQMLRAPFYTPFEQE